MRYKEKLSQRTPKELKDFGKKAVTAERDAADFPQEAGEALLDAAHCWAEAGEPDRARELYDRIIAQHPGEDAQYARVSKADLLWELGRDADSEAEIARLTESDVHVGAACMLAELREAQDRLEEALHWFNISAAHYLARGVDSEKLLLAPELDGRRRVRAALGLAPDDIDEEVETVRTEFLANIDAAGERLGVGDELSDLDDGYLDDLYDEQPTPKPTQGTASYFVRQDVTRAVREGYAHMTDTDVTDPQAYFHALDRSWRQTVRELGLTRFQLYPATLDAFLDFAADNGLDPAQEQTRVDFMRSLADSGAAARPWPPERNAACWCESGRKYKKCCGRPGA